MNQRDTVLNHLKSEGSISPLEAIGVYRIFRLAARIEELRRAGYKIVSHRKTDKTGKTYVSYEMAAGEEAA